MTPENPLGNTLHQSQHPLQHPYSVHPIPPSAHLHIHMSQHAHWPQWPFIHVDAQTTTQPPLWHPCAMCTAGMAMLGSAFLQPTGCMLHISKCVIFVNFCTKPC